MQPDPGLDVRGDDIVERLDRVPDLAEAEDLARGELRPHDLLQGRPGLLAQPVQERRTARVHRVVDQHRGDDLAAQRVPVDRVGVPLAQRLREVGVQQPAQVRVVRQRRLDQLVRGRDLRVREQHGQLGLAQTAPGVQQLPDLPVGGQELQGPVEVARRGPGGA